jgi:hypothetical protein
LAGLGSYYVATNPTPGTGVLAGTVTAFSATADGLFTISNTNPIIGGRTIQLDALSLHMSGTAPTATTCQKVAVYMESGIVAPSGGNVAVTPRAVNPASITSGAVINGFSSAMCTIPAAVGSRTLVANTSLPTSLGITGDSYIYAFGADPAIANTALTAVRATSPARLVTTLAPVTIPPQYTAIIDWWWIGQATNGPTFDYEIGYFEA